MTYETCTHCGTEHPEQNLFRFDGEGCTTYDGADGWAYACPKCISNALVSKLSPAARVIANQIFNDGMRQAVNLGLLWLNDREACDEVSLLLLTLVRATGTP